MKIGIMFGGNSLEHEISIVSAFQLKKKLEDIYDITMIYIDFYNNLYYSNKCNLKEFKSNKLKSFKKTKFIKNGFKGLNIDCVIFSFHGENAEDGLMANICDFYNIKYVGSNSLVSGLFLDKYYSYLVLKGMGYNVIDSYLYTYKDFIEGKELEVYPCILKPLRGGSSLGIYVINNHEELILKANEIFKEYKEFIYQKYYNNVLEYNIAISTIGESRLEVINKKDEIFSFNNKYNDSFKLTHHSIIDDRKNEFLEIGHKLYNDFKLRGVIRIDFFMIDDIIYINEVNTIPGALAMYLYDDFVNVIDYEINKCLNISNKIYSKGTYLINNNIDK